MADYQIPSFSAKNKGEKTGHSRVGREKVTRKKLKESGASLEGIKRGALNRWGRRRSVRKDVNLMRLGTIMGF